jgi:transcription factor CRZ1
MCIKPLLDEEATERRNKQMMEQQQMYAGMGQGALQPVPPSMMMVDPAGGSFALPAALLAQYPALQNLDWSQMQQDEGDLSDVGVGMGHRPSFDGSSGGEYYEDDLSEGYVSGTGGGMQGYGGGQQQGMGQMGGGGGGGGGMGGQGMFLGGQ